MQHYTTTGINDVLQCNLEGINISQSLDSKIDMSTSRITDLRDQEMADYLQENGVKEDEDGHEIDLQELDLVENIEAKEHDDADNLSDKSRISYMVGAGNPANKFNDYLKNTTDIKNMDADVSKINDVNINLSRSDEKNKESVHNSNDLSELPITNNEDVLKNVSTSIMSSKRGRKEANQSQKHMNKHEDHQKIDDYFQEKLNEAKENRQPKFFTETHDIMEFKDIQRNDADEIAKNDVKTTARNMIGVKSAGLKLELINRIKELVEQINKSSGYYSGCDFEDDEFHMASVSDLKELERDLEHKLLELEDSSTAINAIKCTAIIMTKMMGKKKIPLLGNPKLSGVDNIIAQKLGRNKILLSSGTEKIRNRVGDVGMVVLDIIITIVASELSD